MLQTLDQATPEFEALINGYHGDPFALLGLHNNTITAFLPGAIEVHVESRQSGAELALMRQTHADGLFQAILDAPQPYLFRIVWPGGEQVTEDPYAFPTLISDFDLYLFAEGRQRDLTTCLGARIITMDNVAGVRFAVWAPNARRVSVVGNFNNWDGRRNPMRLRRDTGIWEIFIPRLKPGEIYKYEILSRQGLLPLKSDPMAREVEIPPKTGSIVSSETPEQFRLPALRCIEPAGLDKPLTIYEVHAPSWMRHYGGKSYSWLELSERLIPYAVELGFTHIELLPIMGHPFGGSWGYQPLSQFAPMPELGSPQDFLNFVDACHQAHLGLILDWVPAHFPTDPHGLAQFDGTALYEHADPKEGFHQDWNTLIFNLGRNEVRQFLIASALYWLDHYRVDGLRVDAVASMLYRDYSRKPGEWIANAHGGRENLEAIQFLRELSDAIGERCPGALLIAEESTAWPGVTKSPAAGGLGFTHKWNMGWMHDTLHFIQEDPINRPFHHDELTFGLVYAFSEHFVLPISHDEVVHGKRSLIGRMPGDNWQKFANLRVYLAFMWAHPGKKLLFMGCEFGQIIEWNHDAELQWKLLENSDHRGIQGLVRALNILVKSEPALYEKDFVTAGFQWIIRDDRSQSVFAFLRHGKLGSAPVLVVCNFTPISRTNYRVGVPAGSWIEILNSDSADFGGTDIGNAGVLSTENMPAHGQGNSLILTLPPLAIIFLRKEQ